MDFISKIKKSDLCLGCGLCEAIDASHCKMQLTEDGFYSPQFSFLSDATMSIVKNVCPGITVHASKVSSHDSMWGNIVKVSNAWSAESDMRRISSSGGVTSALAIYLLETGQVDGVLHVGVEEESYLYNKLFVSRTREEVLQRNSSRYAPAAVFNEIFHILDASGDDLFAFIGKPCDIAAMQNLVRAYPQYVNRISHYLSIFCAGMPSYGATRKALSTFGKNEEPVSLRYRGAGWPGFFTATYGDGSECKMTYNDSWGNILGKQLGLRCKICPDGIGMLADISSGDSWNTKDGYPDFTEGDGRNFCFVRTQKGKTLFDEAVKAGYIVEEELDVDKVRTMQAYQYERRRMVGWRIAAVQIMTLGLLRFDNLGYAHMAMQVRLAKGLREMAGTMKRFLKQRKNM